jgi:ketosteroid isomerase-like protein
MPDTCDMSRSDVDLARRAVAAFNGRAVEEFAAMTADDFEWSPSMSPVDGAVFAGHDGVRRYFAELQGAWERFDIHAEQFLEHAGGVLVLGQLEGRGRGSGASTRASLGMAFDMQDGAITRIRGYLDHDQALRAVGLAQ